MNIHTKYIKMIAIGVNLVFTFTSIVWASPHPVYSLKAPSEYGKIKERWKNKDQDEDVPVVVHIQDAHTSLEAQENIARLIAHFVNEKSDDSSALSSEGQSFTENDLLVCAEGAQGECDTAQFSSYPDQGVREFVAHQFMKKGKFTGSEYQSIVAEKAFELYGVENRDLYLDNYEAYVSVVNKREDILGSIEEVEDILNSLKEVTFSDVLRDFTLEVSAYRHNQKNLIAHIADLISYAQDSEVEILPYVNVSLFFEAVRFENGVTEDQLQNEKKKLCSVVSERGETKEWHTKHAEGRVDDKDYYVYLKGLVHKYGLDANQYHAITQHAKHLEKMSQVDIARLIYEVREMRWQVESSLAKRIEEKEIVSVSHSIELLKILVRLEAVSEDVHYFFDNREMFKDRLLQGKLERVCAAKHATRIQSFQVEPVLREVEVFYRQAEARNEVLVDNAVQKHAEENNRDDVVVLVSGGYHTQGITEELRERDMPYVVVTPQVQKIAADIPYEDRMLMKLTPFENVVTNPSISTIAFQLMSAKKPLIRWMHELTPQVMDTMDAAPLDLDFKQTHEKSVLTALYMVGFIKFVVGEEGFQNLETIGSRFMQAYQKDSSKERDFKQFLRESEWKAIRDFEHTLYFNAAASDAQTLVFQVNGNTIHVDIEKLFSEKFDESLSASSARKVIGDLTADQLTGLYQTIFNFYTVAHPAQVKDVSTSQRTDVTLTTVTTDVQDVLDSQRLAEARPQTENVTTTFAANVTITRAMVEKLALLYSQLSSQDVVLQVTYMFNGETVEFPLDSLIMAMMMPEIPLGAEIVVSSESAHYSKETLLEIANILEAFLESTSEKPSQVEEIFEEGDSSDSMKNVMESWIDANFAFTGMEKMRYLGAVRRYGVERVYRVLKMMNERGDELPYLFPENIVNLVVGFDTFGEDGYRNPVYLQETQTAFTNTFSVTPPLTDKFVWGDDKMQYLTWFISDELRMRTGASYEIRSDNVKGTFAFCKFFQEKNRIIVSTLQSDVWGNLKSPQKRKLKMWPEEMLQHLEQYAAEQGIAEVVILPSVYHHARWSTLSSVPPSLQVLKRAYDEAAQNRRYAYGDFNEEVNGVFAEKAYVKTIAPQQKEPTQTTRLRGGRIPLLDALLRNGFKLSGDHLTFWQVLIEQVPWAILQVLSVGYGFSPVLLSALGLSAATFVMSHYVGVSRDRSSPIREVLTVMLTNTLTSLLAMGASGVIANMTSLTLGQYFVFAFSGPLAAFAFHFFYNQDKEKLGRPGRGEIESVDTGASAKGISRRAALFKIGALTVTSYAAMNGLPGLIAKATAATDPYAVKYEEDVKIVKKFVKDAFLSNDPVLRKQGFVQIGAFGKNANAAFFHDAMNQIPGIEVRTVLIDGLQKVVVRMHKGKELGNTYEDVIDRIHKKMGLEKWIVRHIIKKESKGDPTAISSAGARGISQVMPDTMKFLIRESRNLPKYKKKVAALKASGKGKGHAEFDFYTKQIEIFTPLDDIVSTIYAGGDKYGKSDGDVRKIIDSVRGLGFYLGPLNLSFGMTNLAYCYNQIEYQKKTGALDKDTETNVAAQMSYNRGLRGFVKRITSLGGWSKIFDIPANPWSRSNKTGKPYVPTETADYGYQFIRDYMRYRSATGKPYQVHKHKQLHLKMCLMALERSRIFSSIRKELKKKRYITGKGGKKIATHYIKEEVNLRTALKNTRDRASRGKATPEDIAHLKNVMKTLPRWPLIRQMEGFLLQALNSFDAAGTSVVKEQSQEVDVAEETKGVDEEIPLKTRRTLKAKQKKKIIQQPEVVDDVPPMSDEVSQLAERIRESFEGETSIIDIVQERVREQAAGFATYAAGALAALAFTKKATDRKGNRNVRDNYEKVLIRENQNSSMMFGIYSDKDKKRKMMSVSAETAGLRPSMRRRSKRIVFWSYVKAQLWVKTLNIALLITFGSEKIKITPYSEFKKLMNKARGDYYFEVDVANKTLFHLALFLLSSAAFLPLVSLYPVLVPLAVIGFFIGRVGFTMIRGIRNIRMPMVRRAAMFSVLTGMIAAGIILSALPVEAAMTTQESVQTSISGILSLIGMVVAVVVGKSMMATVVDESVAEPLFFDETMFGDKRIHVNDFDHMKDLFTYATRFQGEHIETDVEKELRKQFGDYTRDNIRVRFARDVVTSRIPRDVVRLELWFEKGERTERLATFTISQHYTFVGDPTDMSDTSLKENVLPSQTVYLEYVKSFVPGLGVGSFISKGMLLFLRNQGYKRGILLFESASGMKTFTMNGLAVNHDEGAYYDVPISEVGKSLVYRKFEDQKVLKGFERSVENALVFDEIAPVLDQFEYELHSLRDGATDDSETVENDNVTFAGVVLTREDIAHFSTILDELYVPDGMNKKSFHDYLADALGVKGVARYLKEENVSVHFVRDDIDDVSTESSLAIEVRINIPDTSQPSIILARIAFAQIYTDANDRSPIVALSALGTQVEELGVNVFMVNALIELLRGKGYAGLTLGESRDDDEALLAELNDEDLAEIIYTHGYEKIRPKVFFEVLRDTDAGFVRQYYETLPRDLDGVPIEMNQTELILVEAVPVERTSELELANVTFQESDFEALKDVFMFVGASLEGGEEVEDGFENILRNMYDQVNIEAEDITVELSRESVVHGLVADDALAVYVHVKGNPVMEFYVSQVYEQEASLDDDAPLKALRLDYMNSHVQGFGVGTYMLDAFLEVLRDKGYERLLLYPLERTQEILANREWGLNIKTYPRHTEFMEARSGELEDGARARLYTVDSIDVTKEQNLVPVMLQEINLRDPLYVFINYDNVHSDMLCDFTSDSFKFFYESNNIRPVFYSAEKTTEEIEKELYARGFAEYMCTVIGKDEKEMQEGTSMVQRFQNVLDSFAISDYPDTSLVIDTHENMNSLQSIYQGWVGVVDPSFAYRDLGVIKGLAQQGKYAATIMSHINYAVEQRDQGLSPSEINAINPAIVDMDSDIQAQFLAHLAQFEGTQAEQLSAEQLALLQSFILEDFEMHSQAGRVVDGERGDMLADQRAAVLTESESEARDDVPAFNAALSAWRADDFKTEMEAAFKKLFADILENIPEGKDRVVVEEQMKKTLMENFAIYNDMPLDVLLTTVLEEISVSITVAKDGDSFDMVMTYRKGLPGEKVICGFDEITQLYQFKADGNDVRVPALLLDFFYSDIEDIGIGTSLLRIFFDQMHGRGFREVIMYAKSKTRTILAQSYGIDEDTVQYTERLTLEGRRYYKHFIDSQDDIEELEDEAADIFSPDENGVMQARWRTADMSVDLKQMVDVGKRTTDGVAATQRDMTDRVPVKQPIYLFIDVDSLFDAEGNVSDIARDFNRDYIEQMNTLVNLEPVFFSYDKGEEEMKSLLARLAVGDVSRYHFIGAVGERQVGGFKDFVQTDEAVKALGLELKEDLSNAIIINTNQARDNVIHQQLLDGRVSEEDFGLIGIVDPLMERDADFEAMIRGGEFVPTIAGHVNLFFSLGIDDADFSIAALSADERFHNVIVAISEELQLSIIEKIDQLKREELVKTAA